MNLYLITQEVNNNYDTYDSAVVAAETEDEARAIHPSSLSDEETWAPIEHVVVKLIGVAAPGIEGVICASFNAG